MQLLDLLVLFVERWLTALLKTEGEKNFGCGLSGFRVGSRKQTGKGKQEEGSTVAAEGPAIFPNSELLFWNRTYPCTIGSYDIVVLATRTD